MGFRLRRIPFAVSKTAQVAPSSFLCELEFIIVCRDFNPVSRFELSFEQAQGQWVEDSFLHGAFRAYRPFESAFISGSNSWRLCAFALKSFHVIHRLFLTINCRMNGCSAAMSKF